MIKVKKTSLFLAAAVLLLILFIVFYLAPVFRGEIRPLAVFSIGPIRLHLYSLAFLAAVIAAYLFLRRRAGNFNLTAGTVEDLILLNIAAGFFGARLHHVLSFWSYYAAEPIRIVKIWQGGLGIYGGIAAGVIATLIYARRKGLGFLSLADFFAPALALGQAIGRWGNFFNAEAYGLPTALPWKMFIAPQNRLPEYLSSSFYHPLFLYESLWDLLIFFVLVAFAGRKTPVPSGRVFAGYLILYSVGRFLIENLRADKTIAFGHPLNQLLALGFLAAGLAVLLCINRRPGGLPKVI